MMDLTKPLLQKLESLGRLCPEERQSIEAMPLTGKSLKTGDVIAREGDEPSHCCLVVEGFLHRYSILIGGERQTLSIHVPGDIPDLQGLHLQIMDHTLASIGPSKVALISHHDMLSVLRKTPRLVALFWRESLTDAANARTWVKVLGGHDALGKFAHLLCEVYVRMGAVGLTRDNSCAFPFTQAQLGEALGLSSVHVDRTLMKLRAEGLADLRKKTLSILDWERLRDIAEFDPAYLNLRASIGLD